MASTPATSEVDAEEDTGTMRFDVEKTGRAAEYPDFAIIWSFLQNFKHLLHFPDLSLDDLEDGFNSHSSENGNVELIEELYKKLLRRLGFSVNPEKWEKSLLKVVKGQRLFCTWDLEHFGYEKLKVSSKLELFKLLLESQFDQNDKLKSSVNKGFEAEDLRMQPIGRDLDGFIYWYHEDKSNSVRLYTTEEDEVNCESWRLLAGETEELSAVVEFLESKSEVNPKEIALAKREEMKKKGKIKTPGKKKGKKAKRKESNGDDDDFDDDNPCARCFSNASPEKILLCDKCDAAYHTACLRPPLLTVPQGDWFCPFCQQLVLLENLREKKTRLAARMKLRQRQAKRLGFAGIDLNNILQKASDDEEDQGIRRSGRSRKNVDYTFREFEEDITTAVENDKKRFKADEVHEEEQGLMYSKPAYETGGLLDKARLNTRRSRRLMDLDYESDSESRTSGYEYEGNSDEDTQSEVGQRVSTWQGKLRKARRVIEEDDDDDDDNDVGDGSNGACNNEVKSDNAEEPCILKSEQGEDVKDEKEGSVKDEESSASSKSGKEVKSESSDAIAGKPANAKANPESESKEDKDEKIATSGNESQVGVATVFITPQSQNAARPVNKIHPHSRIASVAPLARDQPSPDMNNFRSPSGYPPEGVFPNPPSYDILKPQFPAKHEPGHLGANFVGVNMTGTNSAGNNFTGTPNLHLIGAQGMLQGGSSFPAAQGMGLPGTRTSFAEPGQSALGQGVANYSSADLGFPGTNLGGSSGPNFAGSFSGVANEVNSGVARNFGAPTNFVDSSPSGSNLADFGALKNPARNVPDSPASFWGGQNELNSVYGYQAFGQSPGATQPPVNSPTINQALPSPYPSGSQFGGFNPQPQASSNMPNFMASQQSGNFTNPSQYFPGTPRQPPPPYSANTSLNANVYTNRPRESGNIAGNQWRYPEGYGYYSGQGNTAGQSF